MKVSAKTKAKPSVQVDYDVPADLATLTKRFGESVVAAHASGSIVISLQAFIRRQIEKGSSLPDIQKAVTAWKPDVRSAVKQTAFEKVVANLSKLSPQERADMLKQLQSPSLKTASG